MSNIDTWAVLHTRISSMAGMKLATAVVHIGLDLLQSLLYWVAYQAQMGMTEEFEASLQVLRGFHTDISVEVNGIKVYKY